MNKYIRDYTKNGEGLTKRVRSEYEINPNHCKNTECGKLIPYEQRKNEYCGSSCSASVTNVGKVHSDETKKLMRESQIKTNGGLSMTQCKNCEEEYPTSKRTLYCTNGCRVEYEQRHMSEFAKYKSNTRFDFNMKDYPNEFNFQLIKEHGWYQPVNRGNNLDGVSRDHMLSVRDGFELDINPKLLAHPANCELMKHTDNISKNRKSSITKEELLERINLWNNKYII